jgi:hypothetical protein
MSKSKLIHAELKNGNSYTYLWLGNDYFADLFKDWDFETNEGKYEGMVDFDRTFSFTIEMDEIKNEESIIGMSFDTDLKDSEIVDFDLEEINWAFSLKNGRTKMNKDIEIIDDVIASLYDDYEREQDYAQKIIGAWLRIKKEVNDNE